MLVTALNPHIGYDNAAKKYNTFWIDSKSTGMYVDSGEWNEADKAWTFHGEMTDPMSGASFDTSLLGFPVPRCNGSNTCR